MCDRVASVATGHLSNLGAPAGPSAWILTGALSHTKTANLRQFHGASRARTGDLLGAISALSWQEFGLTSGLLRLLVNSPNTFPNTLQPVLQ
jgi:hypothetical protein